MREKGSWSSATYTSRATEAKETGSATHKGEQRAREGKGLDPLVDPKGHGVIRQALNLLVPDGDEFVLSKGAAMPVKTDLDTTGSMGGNIEIAFASLPNLLHLVAQGSRAVLKRYHPQIATGVVQDQGDEFPYEHTQFEPDNEIDRQMGLLVPNKGGGDATEDYQLGLYAAAHLTETSIINYGLKGYYFAVGDECGRDEVRSTLIRQIFGEAHAKLQGNQPTRELGQLLLTRWHGFFLQVGTNPSTTRWWERVFAKDRVVILPKTKDLALVQACIIGLTEGVLDLQSVPDFLRAEAKTSKEDANGIVRAIGHIPLRAQAELPGFADIPLVGSRFASRADIWPIDKPKSEAVVNKKLPAAKSGGKEKTGTNWKL